MILTNIVSYGLQQLLLSAKMHVSPFTGRMLLLLPIAAVAWGIHALLPTFSSVWIDLFVRSALVGTGLLLTLLVLRITPELMSMLEGKLPKRLRH